MIQRTSPLANGYVRRPHARLPLLWPLLINPRLREQDTARRQIEALSFHARDIRHIVLTHLDFDHAGGLEDFPDARVHVLAAEHEAAKARSGFVAHQRYRARQWDEVRDWRFYEPGGEGWRGFDAVRDLDGLPPEILMLPLRGHTLGHAGVAIQSERSWLLHAGDAYLHSAEMSPCPSCPPGLALYERIMDSDHRARVDNQARLRTLKHDEPTIKVFCSHDVSEFAALSAAPS
ncbi:MBL fold metallo-hydrolase [Vitreimonas flagellata]|uniref:MBL fold metallo-hydrolase n=1 Tax=Vitreimonas flagellata TaxID=2560861 RepID=UPI001EF89B61|nr:MBL fold metallo-hydrolase [Vitreimonas flagellata]